MDIMSTPSWAGAWVPPSNSTLMTAFSGKVPATCVEIKFYGVFALNLRVDLHAIDAACSMAWCCSFLTARRASTTASSRAPDALVDFHTARDVDEDLDGRVVVLGIPNGRVGY